MFQKYKEYDKIGVIIHQPLMWIHYSPIFQCLRQNSFSVILTENYRKKMSSNQDSDEMALFQKIQRLGYQIEWAGDLIKTKKKYRYVISNIFIEGEFGYLSIRDTLRVFTKNILKKILNRTFLLRSTRKYLIARQYLPLRLGVKQIRFMYGADISPGWGTSDWNHIYDLILCHGPNDENALRDKFDVPTRQIGYPRYDGYFQKQLDTKKVAKEFSIDPSKKTILWMPTMGVDASSSIPYFAIAISGLKKRYNVIVRPHPMSFAHEKENIELLHKYKFKIDELSYRDMNKLYKSVDIVLCDFGGTPFGCLYLGKPFVILKVPDIENSSRIKNSSNEELAEHAPCIEKPSAIVIEKIIEDEKFWAELTPKICELRKKYFADLRGNSAETTAKYLSMLDKIIRN
jgi:hypothetical protein